MVYHPAIRKGFLRSSSSTIRWRGIFCNAPAPAPLYHPLNLPHLPPLLDRLALPEFVEVTAATVTQDGKNRHGSEWGASAGDFFFPVHFPHVRESNYFQIAASSDDVKDRSTRGAAFPSLVFESFAKWGQMDANSTAMPRKQEKIQREAPYPRMQSSTGLNLAQLGGQKSFSHLFGHGMGRHFPTRRVFESVQGVGSGPSYKSYSSAASERTQISIDGNQLDSLQPGTTEASGVESVLASLPHGDALREVAVAAADCSVPTAFVQYVIDGVHVSTGLPWWASIVATTVAIRFLVLPIMIYQMKATARLTLLRPELEKLTNRIKESNYDPKVVEDNQVHMKALFVRHKTTPFSPILGAFVQAPIFMCFFFGIRNMAEKMDSFKEGGIWWFTDLSTPDSLFIMPVLSGAFFLLTVELGAADGMQGQPMLGKMKNFMRGLSVLLVPLTASFPKALFCYWLTANVFSLIQAAVLKQPGVKSVLGIPDVSHLAKPADIPLQPVMTYSQAPKPKGESRAKRWKS